MVVQKRGGHSPPNRRVPRSPYRKPRSGDVIDERYRIVGRPLGKGGMGTVYRVEDPSNATWALKRLDPALREEKRFEKRFRLEYEAAADLRHPNITAYHELFDADGTLFIRMELIEGVNLRKLMKSQKRMPPPVVAGIGRSLARALEHLHAHRVVHRDLKPENILLGFDGSIKLSDFGISRVEYAALTRTGTLLGTPRYMSPEQLAGKKGGDIGPEADLYALGVLLYEMLTGKDPYRLPRKAEVLEIINIKHKTDPKPLPEDIDPEFRSLIMRLLQRDPEDRPSDARWVGQELGRWSASRKSLRGVLNQWVADIGGPRSVSPQMPMTRKKRESYWKKERALSELPSENSDCSHGHELLPAFLGAIVFLLILWGIGFWHQRQDAGATLRAQRQKVSLKEKRAAEQKKRSFVRKVHHNQRRISSLRLARVITKKKRVKKLKRIRRVPKKKYRTLSKKRHRKLRRNRGKKRRSRRTQSRKRKKRRRR